MICQICKKIIEETGEESKTYFTDYMTRRLVGIMSCNECHDKAEKEHLYLFGEDNQLVQEPDIDYDEIPALD